MHIRHVLGQILALLVISQASQAAMPAKIEIVTEEFPPTVLLKDGKVTGLATEVVQAILKEVNVEANIQILPWARALQVVDENENTAIYAMSRSAEREAKYKWVGVLYEAKNYIYAIPEKNIKISTLDDCKKYKIGVVTKEIREDYLVKKGFSTEVTLEHVNKHDLNYKKLKNGRIDLWPASEFLAASIVKENGDDPRTAIVPVFEMTDLTPYSGSFLAFGPKTSDEVVAKFKEGYEKIKANGTYDSLQKKWRDVIFAK